MANTPRLQVPMTDETRAQLQAFADARGSSLPAVCRDLLEEMAPVAADMAKALQSAKQAPAKALRDAVNVLEVQMAKADQLRLDLTPKATGKKRKKAG